VRGGQGERIRQEWRQNARLRWGVLVVVLILGARGVLAVSDARVEIAKQQARDTELLARLEATAAETDWPRRARRAEAARSAMLAGLPEARTEGAARADLLARLDQLAKDAVIATPTVRVETVLDIPDEPGLRQAVGRIEGTVATRLDVAPVARALAAGLPWMQVEQLEFAEGEPVRVSAIVRTLYRIPDDARPAEVGTAASTATAGFDAPATASTGSAPR
jgi:Tfp pilus assembly protein PilO